MSYTPRRTQYFFDLSGVACKSRGDINTLRYQWDTFERVENYNDIVYQRLQNGDRSQLFYQFPTRGELNAYKNGQELHILRYPYLPPGTFSPISQLPYPNVTFYNAVPTYNQAPKPCAPVSSPMTASEFQTQQADMSIYVHVSTFNGTHHYKYIFPSNEEQLAYHRAERIALAPPGIYFS